MRVPGCFPKWAGVGREEGRGGEVGGGLCLARGLVFHPPDLYLGPWAMARCHCGARTGLTCVSSMIWRWGALGLHEPRWGAGGCLGGLAAWAGTGLSAPPSDSCSLQALCPRAAAAGSECCCLLLLA
jgi:hypothetical protein